MIGILFWIIFCGLVGASLLGAFGVGVQVVMIGAVAVSVLMMGMFAG